MWKMEVLTKFANNNVVEIPEKRPGALKAGSLPSRPGQSVKEIIKK